MNDKTANADLAARQCAWAALDAVLIQGRTLDQALADVPDLGRLAPRDRAFARLLLVTVLRRWGALRALLKLLIERSLSGDAKSKAQGQSAEHALALGLAQLFYLDTQPHAAVDTTVRLIGASHVAGLKGLANAVLRRAARDKAALLAKLDEPRIDVPDHLWESWVGAYGEANASAIAAAHLREPPLDLTVIGDAAGWAARLGAQILPTGSLRLANAGAIESLAGFSEGKWWVQDAAAALPVRLLGDVAGKSVADLCAAPGGKTMQLASAGARVTAVDRSAPRLERLRANLARCHLEAKIVTADAALWRANERFDAILLDAPCTATGTIRRQPDVAWSKTLADIGRLADLQARLLSHAATLLRPGGTLIYCVCSLQPEEGETQIEKFLAAYSAFKLDPIAPEEAPGLQEAIAANGAMRVLPSLWAERGGLDGFYIARLRRD